MGTYNIDAENNITALGSQQANFEGEIFANRQELADLAAKWPANRLIEVWNGIPGLTPVKKFTDRKSAVSRIWKAIQSLGGSGVTQGATPATTMRRSNWASGAGPKPRRCWATEAPRRVVATEVGLCAPAAPKGPKPPPTPPVTAE